MTFRRGSNQPSYAEVEAPSQDKDCTVIIDPKQSFILSDRRESEQKDGFIVGDQRERFLVSESTWPQTPCPTRPWGWTSLKIQGCFDIIQLRILILRKNLQPLWGNDILLYEPVDCFRPGLSKRLHWWATEESENWQRGSSIWRVFARRKIYHGICGKPAL